MLSYATSRFRWGNLIYAEPSRFLEELEDSYVDWPVHLGKTEIREQPSGGSLFRKKVSVPSPKGLKKVSTTTPSSNGEFSNPGDLNIGSQVEHANYGKGKVIAIEGEEPNQKAIVYFPAVGQKQLLLRFAKLKRIG